MHPLKDSISVGATPHPSTWPVPRLGATFGAIRVSRILVGQAQNKPKKSLKTRGQVAREGPSARG